MILIGYGYWGQILSRIFDQEIDIICDKEHKKHKKIHCFDINQAIKLHKGKKVGIIATNASSHYDNAKILLKSGYDLWIEKPVTLNIDELDELIYLAEQNKSVVFVDYPYCYDDNINKMKTIDIGTPLYYRSIRLASGTIRNDTSPLYDLAIHDLSILNYLYPNFIFQTSNIFKISDDHFILNITFTNNFKAVIECSWSFPEKKRIIFAKGSNFCVTHDSVDQNTLRLFNNKFTEQQVFFNQNETLQNAKKHFLYCIKTRKIPRTNLYNSKKIMMWLK